MSINSLNPPPIPPCNWSQDAQVKQGYLAFIYGQVLLAGRGGIGYVNDKDQFILYLKITPEDGNNSINLIGVDEVWVVFDSKFMKKGG